MVTGKYKERKKWRISLHIVGNTPDSIVNSSKFAIGKDEVTSSNLVSSSKMNDPTQFEQVNETCEFGGVVVYSESLGMTGISASGALKQI